MISNNVTKVRILYRREGGLLEDDLLSSSIRSIPVRSLDWASNSFNCWGMGSPPFKVMPIDFIMIPSVWTLVGLFLGQRPEMSWEVYIPIWFVYLLAFSYSLQHRYIIFSHYKENGQDMASTEYFTLPQRRTIRLVIWRYLYYLNLSKEFSFSKYE